MPIEITDDRAQVDVRQLVGVSHFLLLTKDKHDFYRQFIGKTPTGTKEEDSGWRA